MDETDLDVVDDDTLLAELDELLRDREADFSEAVASYLRALEHLVTVQNAYLHCLISEPCSEEEKSEYAMRLVLARKRREDAQYVFIKTGKAVMNE